MLLLEREPVGVPLFVAVFFLDRRNTLGFEELHKPPSRRIVRVRLGSGRVSKKSNRVDRFASAFGGGYTVGTCRNAHTAMFVNIHIEIHRLHAALGRNPRGGLTSQLRNGRHDAIQGNIAAFPVAMPSYQVVEAYRR